MSFQKVCDRTERCYPTVILSKSPAARAREMRHGQNEFRLSAPRKSLRPMRQADRQPRMDRKRSAPHLLSLVLRGLRLPFRGGGVLRRLAFGARTTRGLTAARAFFR